ncbi:hypothetical protein ACTTAL_05595 [Rhodobacter capsulatus]|uniref:hypothetical protein n=1 Tax=Rhodobacter capsulatus TaxID=1061 RepID=UPI0003D2D14F|nr:hypothetical protein [Rhodobacter capsulatus]ETD89391.1 hypothetical protein U713_10080 [Rhodobacter capsulatus YW2]
MAADVGFFSASKGEAQIRKALLHIQERAGAPNDGLHARLGPLYDRLSRDLDGPEVAPFRELQRDHILTTWPLAPGDEVLGPRVETRRFHSIRSLANATGMGTVRLRKALVDAGFITPLPTGEGTYPRFHPAEIQRFLDRLLQGAVVTTQAKPDYHDIPAACRRLVCSAREIVALILDGRLKKISRHTEREGYLAVLVNVWEIRPCLVRASASGLTVEQAAEQLGVTQVQMRAMIRDGVMKADLAPNPVTAKPQPYVTEAHLRDFRMEFMTCKDLADWLGLDRDMVTKHLKAADVHPIGPPDKPYGFTYCRLRIHERFVQALRSGAGLVNPISET